MSTRKLKIMLVPDSFKGTLTSMQVISILEKAAVKCFQDVKVVRVPAADGGEGTVEAMVTASQGEYREAEVTNPLGEKICAKYGIINGNIAVIEMAKASGLTLIAQNQRNPLLTTSYGTGELIKAAMDDGLRDIIIGIGGSATNDAGVGACQALGIEFLDKTGINVGFGGDQLNRIKDIDIRNIDTRIEKCNLTVITDVNNPFTGPEGATMIYGPQKGADTATLKRLEQGMEQFGCLIKAHTKIELGKIAGSGAGGGIAGTFHALLGAKIKLGIETILDVVCFDKLLNDIDFVVTGEGKIDSQSTYGKVISGIAKRCTQKNIPVVAIAGVMGDGAQKTYDLGISSIMTSVNCIINMEEACSNSENMLFDASCRMFNFIKVGMNIR